MTGEVVIGLILAHFIGDYLLQSDWMALEKTKHWWPAIAHALTYGIPFLIITRSIPALAVIVFSHAIIDHYRLARYIVWAKNMMAPKSYRDPWSDCSDTGYNKTRAPWMAVWLMIIADNTIHMIINTISVVWL